MGAFCSCWWSIATLMAAIIFLLGLGSYGKEEIELKQIKASQELKCTLLREPGASHVKEVSGYGDSKHHSNPYKYWEVTCDVTVQYQKSSFGLLQNRKAQVFAGTEKRHYPKDSNAWCDETLANEWPNIIISTWSCGKRQGVTLIYNGDPQIGSVKEAFNCDGNVLKDNAVVTCTIDADGNPRIGSLAGLRNQAEGNLHDTRSFLVTMGIVMAAFVTCVCGCCIWACKGCADVRKSRRAEQSEMYNLMT